MRLHVCKMLPHTKKISKKFIMNQKLGYIISQLKCGYLLGRELLSLVTSICKSFKRVFTYATLSLKSVGLLRRLILKLIYFKHSES